MAFSTFVEIVFIKCIDIIIKSCPAYYLEEVIILRYDLPFYSRNGVCRKQMRLIHTRWHQFEENTSITLIVVPITEEMDNK